MKKPVIIDCDPGHDDAIALLMAFASDALDIKAVTVVAGNQTLDKTLNNALRVLSFAGINTTVAAGASKPLMRKLITAPDVHGISGLDGPTLPEPSLIPAEKNAVEVMAEIIRQSSEAITLIPTGPLTNVALFILTHPELKGKIERISLMGGACFGGNRSPVAEFNIWADPEAASIVFSSGIPITMCGLDVTHKALIYKEEVEKIRGLGRIGRVVAELLDFYEQFYLRQGFSGSPLHDPCAVAWAIDPSLITTRKLHVDVETVGEFTTGATVVDRNNILCQQPNAYVAFDIDRDRFIAMLFESIKHYT